MVWLAALTVSCDMRYESKQVMLSKSCVFTGVSYLHTSISIVHMYVYEVSL